MASIFAGDLTVFIQQDAAHHDALLTGLTESIARASGDSDSAVSAQLEHLPKRPACAKC